MISSTALPVETDVGNYFVSNYPPYSQWSAGQAVSFRDHLQTYRSDEPLGLYVHLPFCRQRCTYCYFQVQTRPAASIVDSYIDNVLEELDCYRQLPAVAGRPVINAYFGGGTPTYLTSDQLQRLLAGLQDRLDWSRADEVTFECQPGTFDREKLEQLQAHGVSRVSLGVQTFSERVLRGVGRAATAADAMQGYHLIRRVGFPEVNVDLIAGLPGENDESWEQTLDQAIELAPDGVTVYQLELAHNSGLYRLIQSGKEWSLPDWPTKRRWHGRAFSAFEAAGYTVCGAYWIVRDPQRNRYSYVADHYWRGRDLLALGESSFGLFDRFHYQNFDRLDSYTGALRDGGLPVQRAYRMNVEEQLRREFILQLKTGHVDVASFAQRFGIDPLVEFSPPLQHLRNHGWLDYDQESVRVTREGLLRIEWLLSNFYLPHHVGVRYS